MSVIANILRVCNKRIPYTNSNILLHVIFASSEGHTILRGKYKLVFLTYFPWQFFAYLVQSKYVSVCTIDFIFFCWNTQLYLGAILWYQSATMTCINE